MHSMNAHGPAAVFSGAMHNQLKTLLLLGLLSAILIGFGAMLGRQWVGAFTILALALNLGAYFFSDRVVLRMHRAEPIDPARAPRLSAMVQELSANAGIPMPRLYRIASAQPNAFATGRNAAHGVVW